MPSAWSVVLRIKKISNIQQEISNVEGMIRCAQSFV